MSNIYTIGETIYDIIFKNDEPFTAKAGGAMLNTAVSLGRLGLPVHLISEYGTDRAGGIINNFLSDNGVDTSFVYRYSDGKTAVSHAFLDEKNDASYSFYKIYPGIRLQTKIPDFHSGDIVLFGGFYSLMKEVRTQIVSLVAAAKEAGALVIYDPNVRSPHKEQIGSLRQMVYENLQMADLVRGSDEDFMTILDIPDAEGAYDLVCRHGCNYLIYTKSNKEVILRSPSDNLSLPVPEVDVISTIGAGDTFNAGLIFELKKQGINPGEIRNADHAAMAKTAIKFGSHACTHYENYISKAFARGMIRVDGS